MVELRDLQKEHFTGEEAHSKHLFYISVPKRRHPIKGIEVKKTKKGQFALRLSIRDATDQWLIFKNAEDMFESIISTVNQVQCWRA